MVVGRDETSTHYMVMCRLMVLSQPAKKNSDEQRSRFKPAFVVIEIDSVLKHYGQTQSSKNYS